MTKAFTATSTLLLTLLSGGAAACVFGVTYNLPIPFEMYASGAAAALVASFVVVGYVLKAQTVELTLNRAEQHYEQVPVARIPRLLVSGFAWASMLGLLLTIATGLVGTPDRLANFGMTFFWIIFALGLTYATALLGDVYAFVNPWLTLCHWFEQFKPNAFRGRLRYPKWLGYYPALAVYMAFVWIELFGEIQPRTLSEILLVYTALNLTAAWLVGKESWVRYVEFFSVFFRLIGKMAPVEYVPTADPGHPYQVQLRKPFIGLLEVHADGFSLLLFVIFMLSSTAFDGVHETLPWVGLFWKGIYPVLAAVFEQPYFFFVTIYYAWQSAMLFLLPLFYLLVYLFLIWLAKRAAQSNIPVRTLALRFAFTLIPIGFVYNVTHYYTDLFAQGVLIVRMISDPFNLGWNLFGTVGWLNDPIVLDAGSVWHTQVGLILFGHIVSVYLAHVEALKVFPNRRHAMLSQLPMLVLMVLLTTFGLWILSLPIGAAQVPSSSIIPISGFGIAVLPIAFG